jgi:hypothetical protein
MQLESLVSLFKNNGFTVDLNQNSDTGYFSLTVLNSNLRLPHDVEIRSLDYDSLLEVKLSFHKEGLFVDPNIESVCYHVLRMINTLLNEYMYRLYKDDRTDEICLWQPFHLKIERLMQIYSMGVAYDAVIHKCNIEENMWIQDAMGNNVIQAYDGELFIFIDQEPNANWSHPCIYALIDLETDDLRFERAEWPPTHEIKIDWNQKH